MKTLEARWAGTEGWVDVDYVAHLDEAKTRAIQFQLDHHVRCPIEWTPGSFGIYFGQNKYVTFRLKEP
jgi:hypothetical protein